MPTINIDHVTRIEGHASITIQLDDDGKVADTQFHVTQIRGFEKFVEGRPYYEMPSITARICGICPVSHLLASSKACDAIMAVRIPRDRGQAARAAPHGPDRAVARALVLPPLRARPAAGHGLRPGQAQRGGAARGAPGRRAATVCACASSASRSSSAWARSASIHRGRCPVASTPGSTRRLARRRSQEWPEALAIVQRTLELWKGTIDAFPDEVASFSNFPTMYAGWSGPTARCELYDGNLRFATPTGEIVADQVAPAEYQAYIGEATHARLLPQGAVLQAARAGRRHLPGGPAGATQRLRPHLDAAGERRAAGDAPAAGPSRAEQLPQPLRPAHRGPVRAGTHEGAARGPQHPRHQGARPRRRQRP